MAVVDGAVVGADGPPIPPRRRGGRRPTVTSAFGSGRREAHDASGFYRRFAPPSLSGDDIVAPAGPTDVIHHGDARSMVEVPTSSVALVVTSPPYFAGKEYEADLGRDGVPASYLEYLQLLRDVFCECARVLEPGGRLAVNVANLGRRPYRSLSSDVIAILQDDLGLLLRGEVVWVKGRAQTGSCAWGSFQSPANPVLRDVTERVVVAAKGRFDRAPGPRARREAGLPSEATITRDEFLEATTDVWELAPERASRVGHPAPFPVELPQRLIELYTYRGDVVLDPFMGSGTTAVAALRCGRRYIGYDTDRAYVRAARRRVAAEAGRAVEPRIKGGGTEAARRGGRRATEVAAVAVREAGFSDLEGPLSVRGTGVEVALSACDRRGRRWFFMVCGGFTTGRRGLARAETLWRTIGEAAVLHQVVPTVPLVVLTTEVPRQGPAAKALEAVTGRGRPLRAVVDLADREAPARLRHLARR